MSVACPNCQTYPCSNSGCLKPLQAEIAELLAALSELHDFAEVSTHYRHQQRSESAFDNAANLIIKHDAAVIEKAKRPTTGGE